MEKHDVVIIGGGPAGLTAGIYAARSGLKTVVVDKGMAEGSVSEVPFVENYPGFKSIRGMKLMDRIRSQAEKYVDIHKFEVAQKVVHDGEIVVTTDKGKYISNALIFATGTSRKKLGVLGEAEFLGKGVSHCPTCDGLFFKGKKVLVVGGGNAAVVDALHLKKIGCEVTLIHRRDKLRAERALQNNLFNAGIGVIWNSIVEKIKGKDILESVAVKNVKDNSKTELRFDGVFVSVGEVPNSDLAKVIGVALDEEGYIITDKNQRTNVARVYAAGDVTSGARQIVVACAEGAVAALSVFKELESGKR